ncbi:hypothetical protein HPB50_025585 [Hyalomma asiaticum]|uniref:Uncharacterized protein n=1 Tax=Hyalomma asiaticum TaxID=266040 RepID=A0ACB7ST77_HYAAI|nr:hypothetical protein HPB50_025585 [Hyalomma asiaticum]
MSGAGGANQPVSSVDKYFGLELLFKACKDTLKSKSDALVLLVHYMLWAQNSDSTELLPDGWNDNQSLYTLRYASVEGSERFVLKVIPSGVFLLVNVLNVSKERTASTNVTLNKFISDNFQELRKTYKNVDDLISKLNADLVTVLGAMDSSTQVAASREASRMWSEENNPLHIPSRQPGIEWSPLQEGPRLGQRDLNPFYQGPPGGGMLMDPRQLPRPHHSDPGVGIPGIPRGSIPPGARFDPFGPPRPDAPGAPSSRFAGPNPDHLPPPPDYDDMFS